MIAWFKRMFCKAADSGIDPRTGKHYLDFDV